MTQTDGAGFEGFKAKYDLLAETPGGRELGNRVGILYPEYKALGDSLMDQVSASLANSTSKADNLVEWRSEIIRGGRSGWQPASHFDVTTLV